MKDSTSTLFIYHSIIKKSIINHSSYIFFNIFIINLYIQLLLRNNCVNIYIFIFLNIYLFCICKKNMEDHIIIALIIFNYILLIKIFVLNKKNF